MKTAEFYACCGASVGDRHELSCDTVPASELRQVLSRQSKPKVRKTAGLTPIQKLGYPVLVIGHRLKINFLYHLGGRIMCRGVAKPTNGEPHPHLRNTRQRKQGM